jgi:hypothetical protein
MKFKVVNSRGSKSQSSFEKVLANPNWFQGQKEFLRQGKIWHEIFGNEYIYMFYGVGSTPEAAKRLYTLPPNLVTSELKSNEPFFQITEPEEAVKYFFTFKNEELPLDPRTIIHMNDNRVVLKEGNDKNLLQGESKLKALAPALSNIRLAYESRGVILKYRGAIGILSNEGKDAGGYVPLEASEIDKIQSDYQKYGTTGSQAQLIITSAAVKWQSMMVNNPKNLGLFEEVEEDFNKILDAFGVPSEMMVRNKGATFENQRQANKSLYENTIIPEAAEWTDSVNNKVFQDSNLSLVPDFSHLHIFQEDIKAKSETLLKMVDALTKMRSDGQITSQEYREELFKLGIGNGEEIQNQV